MPPGGGTSLDEDIGRPFLDKRYDYHAVSTSTADRIETDYTTNVTSGTLAISDTNLAYVEPTSAGGGGYTDLDETLYYDDDGVQSWTKHKDATISYRGYTDGRMTTSIEDVDTAQTSNEPQGLSSSGTEIHRTTTYAYDKQGRLTTTTFADGQVTKSYYTKLADGRLVTLGYQDFETSPSTKYYGPVSYSVTNHAGKVEFEGRVALTNNESTTTLANHVDEAESDPLLAMDLGTVCRMTTHVYDDTGTRLQESRLYFDIPASGAGSDGTNYDPTKFGYDDMGRRWRTKEASGTIHRTVHDDLGRVASRWIGTNDSSFSGGETSGTDDMVKTEELVYDAGADGGNSYLTKRTLYVQGDATGKRETSYTNDVRGRALVEDRPTAPHTFHKYDNRGRRLGTGLFSSTANIVAGTDDPTTETSNRLALSEWAFNDLGQLYATKQNKIDDADGSDDDEITTEYGYDEMGRRIYVQGGEYAKTFYDRLGRETHHLVLADENDTTYGDRTQSTSSGDTILEEHQTVFDSDNDDILMRVGIMRFPSSLMNTKLDSEADGDRLLVTDANITGRVQISAYWYDELGRETDRIAYGTYGESDFDRDGLSVPSRSDTELVTSTDYGDDGEVLDITDPRAFVMHFDYDDAGRQTKVRRHYDANVNGGNPSGTDDNQTVVYEYTDGLRTKIKVDMPAGTDDQETIYTYGVTKGTSAGDSKIGNKNLLWKVQYPDSSGGTDVVSYAYNAQQERIYEKDQEGNVIENDFDDSGRQTHRRITTLDADFDGDVRRITTAYDNLGRRSTITQYDNATVGSGTVVDEVKFTYDDWGNVDKYEQDHDSTVGGGGSLAYYEVSYSYEKDLDGRPAVRKTGVTLPSGNVITYGYGSAGSQHDDADLVLTVKDDTVTLATYTYLGSAMVVRTTYNEPGIFSTLYTSGYGTYGNLDRFNRVTTSSWTSDLATDRDFYDVDMSYDRNGNVTLVNDNTHAGKDVSYTMDDLDRLARAQQGTWGGSSISSEKRDEEWTLDHTGNWDFYRLDFNDDGDGLDTNELEDDRTHNKVNELLGRDTDDNGTDNYTLVYDADGNLTDDDETYKYTYDPFGRLCLIQNQSSATVADMEYNGLGHLKSIHADTDDDGDVDASDKWFHAAYDEAWRMVAYYREADDDPKEEFVPAQAGVDGEGGSSYINGVVCRNKDANTAWTDASDGVLEERLFYCQNWRGDVVALVHKNRLQVESVRYSPYGEPFGLPEPDADSDGDRDAADGTQISAWINQSAYDVRGDVDLDGDVDSTDLDWGTTYGAATLGWGELSWRANRMGFAGSEKLANAPRLYSARNRAYNWNAGRWSSRDPLPYIDGPSLYAFASENPAIHVDPSGLLGCAMPGGGNPGFPDLFSYGCFCGNKAGPPPVGEQAPAGWDCDKVPGMDALDQCCCKHDQANPMGQSWWQTVKNWFTSACDLADCALESVSSESVDLGAAACVFYFACQTCPKPKCWGLANAALGACAAWLAAGTPKPCVPYWLIPLVW
ncbi:MAG: RHS repeat-associated core domain-containing protein [Candidatus Thermoplasmatota archaeon]